MKEGQVLVASVVAVHDYGIEVEAEGVRGFIQPIEVSWKASLMPGDVVNVGDRVRVLVYARTGERFFASIKQAHPELDPWRSVARLEVGSVHPGTVLDVLDWGVKIGIADGVEGMLPITDPRHVRYSKGQHLLVRIESISIEQRKISFRTLDTA